MPIPYLVSKKADLTSCERKELWYAVQKRVQERGGCIEAILASGQSVVIPDLGTFSTSLTTPGCETPEQVTPGKVKLSRVCFTADRRMTERLRKEKAFRLPFSLYFPEEQITPAMRRADGLLREAE